MPEGSGNSQPVALTLKQGLGISEHDKHPEGPSIMDIALRVQVPNHKASTQNHHYDS